MRSGRRDELQVSDGVPGIVKSLPDEFTPRGYHARLIGASLILRPRAFATPMTLFGQVKN